MCATVNLGGWSLHLTLLQVGCYACQEEKRQIYDFRPYRNERLARLWPWRLVTATQLVGSRWVRYPAEPFFYLLENLGATRRLDLIASSFGGEKKFIRREKKGLKKKRNISDGYRRDFHTLVAPFIRDKSSRNRFYPWRNLAWLSLSPSRFDRSTGWRYILWSNNENRRNGWKRWDSCPIRANARHCLAALFLFFLSFGRLNFFSSSRFRHGRTSFGRGSLSRFNNEDSRSRSSFLLLLMKDRKKRKKIFFCFLGWTIERDRGISTGHKGKPKDNRGLSPSLVSIYLYQSF